jgi:hypothetical protein
VHQLRRSGDGADAAEQRQEQLDPDAGELLILAATQESTPLVSLTWSP